MINLLLYLYYYSNILLMSFFLFFLFFPSFFCSIFNKNGKVDDCYEVQYCRLKYNDLNETNFGCSKYGYCFYRLYDYLIRNEKQSNFDKRFFTCICNKGYATLESDTIGCCYLQKKQSFLFFLELIPGLGHCYRLGCSDNKLSAYAIVKIVIIYSFLVIYITLRIIIYVHNKKYVSQISNTSNEKKKPKNKDSEKEKLIERNNPIKEEKGDKLGLTLHIIKLICLPIIWIFEITDLILIGINYFKDNENVELEPW